MIRRSLDDVLKRARAELRINPTIEVYTFDNGVEQRRSANPWAKFNAEAYEFAKAGAKAFESLGDTLRDAAPKFREFNQWYDDETQRREWRNG